MDTFLDIIPSRHDGNDAVYAWPELPDHGELAALDHAQLEAA